MKTKLERQLNTEASRRNKQMRGYRLESELIAAIKKAAKAFGCNDSDIVRAALRSHLTEYIPRHRRSALL